MLEEDAVRGFEHDLIVGVVLVLREVGAMLRGFEETGNSLLVQPGDGSIDRGLRVGRERDVVDTRAIVVVLHILRPGDEPDRNSPGILEGFRPVGGQDRLLAKFREQFPIEREILLLYIDLQMRQFAARHSLLSSPGEFDDTLARTIPGRMYVRPSVARRLPVDAAVAEGHACVSEIASRSGESMTRWACDCMSAFTQDS